MKDINLAVALLRLCPTSEKITKEKLEEQRSKLYQNYFVEVGQAVKDPWMEIYGAIRQNELGSVLSTLSSFKENILESNTELPDSVEDRLKVVESIVKVSFVDEDLYFFASKLKEIYESTCEEQQNNVKTVENTNFDDLWDDFDFDQGYKKHVEAESTTAAQAVNIDLTELEAFCSAMAVERGVLFSPFFTRSKLEGEMANTFMMKLVSRIKHESSLIIHSKVYNPDSYFDNAYMLLTKIIKQFEMEEMPILQKIVDFFLFFLKKTEQRLQNMCQHQHKSRLAPSFPEADLPPNREDSGILSRLT